MLRAMHDHTHITHNYLTSLTYPGCMLMETGTFSICPTLYPHTKHHILHIVDTHKYLLIRGLRTP